jgi:cell division protein FtsL
VGPTANEIAIYAVETKAIIYVLWGLLMIASITTLSLAIMVVSLKFKVRTSRRRESQLAHQVAMRAAEIQGLEQRLAQASTIEPAAVELKAEIRRLGGIRAKTEERLVAQNEEIEALRGSVADQNEELSILRELVAHSGVRVANVKSLRSAA